MAPRPSCPIRSRRRCGRSIRMTCRRRAPTCWRRRITTPTACRSLIARCGNIYGGGDLNWTRIVPGTIRSLLRGERPIVRSDGTFVRDYLYVKDAASAYVCLAEAAYTGRLRGGAVNFGGSARRTVLEVVADLQRLTGRTDLSPDIRNTAQAEIREQWLSFDKATQTLGWTPAYTMDQGLRETLDWYRRWFGDWERCVSECPICTAGQPVTSVTRPLLPSMQNYVYRTPTTRAGLSRGPVLPCDLLGLRVFMERRVRSITARVRRRLRQRRAIGGHGSALHRRGDHARTPPFTRARVCRGRRVRQRRVSEDAVPGLA